MVPQMVAYGCFPQACKHCLGHDQRFMSHSSSGLDDCSICMILLGIRNATLT